MVLLLTCTSASSQALPDAPGFLLAHSEPGATVAYASSSDAPDADPPTGQRAAGQQGEALLQDMPRGSAMLPPPCPRNRAANPADAATPRSGCIDNPLQLIVTHPTRPLTSHEKGILAMRDFSDPFNLLVITATAGFSVAANAQSAFGPGFKGWGRLTGYSLVECAQGEFVGTYMISSLAHQDPRYHRMPDASVKRRIGHALVHTFWTQHDNGRPMLNFETLLTYPASAELTNLYVPGIQTDARSTVKRVGIGLATDPAGNLIAEFLPDVARRIHVRAVFMQQILNQVALGAPAVQ
jgi:hypothetical protein